MQNEREYSPQPPGGFFQRFSWYGPGLLWMVSSVGSGSVLFTPRVGGRYGYSLAWVVFVVIFFQWVWIREIGRFTVVTGRTILDGYSTIPGPRGWAVWFIIIPQFFAAVFTVSGIASLIGSALMIALPGAHWFYGTAMIIVSIILVLLGKYKGVEKIASLLAAVLVLVTVVTAVVVFPSSAEPVAGLIPNIPPDFDFYFLLPWIGFMLAGAAGILWYSYWVAEKGYGGKVTGESATQKNQTDISSEEIRRRLRIWNHIMSTSSAIAVIAAGIVTLAFLVLGTELLLPRGIIPEGIEVARDLTTLLEAVWGRAGFWLLIVGIFIALFGTILSNQDGWGRSFADATLILLPSDLKKGTSDSWLINFVNNRLYLKNFYASTVTALIPLVVFLIVREPVALLSFGGIIAAIHMPVIVLLTQYVNVKNLPAELRPGRVISWVMYVSGFIYIIIGLIYLYDAFV
ncbi:Manganese transport protein MntH [Chitinispirillum alkaliphilum]|nr:Manganese transport protein MntH [Chitinispirillum alkaliphilum]